MKTDIKLGDVVCIKATANKDSYNDGSGPGWDGAMTDIAGKNIEGEVIDITHDWDRVHVRSGAMGTYWWRLEDVSEPKKFIEQGMYCITDARTREVLRTAIAHAKTPSGRDYFMPSSEIIFIDEEMHTNGLIGALEAHKDRLTKEISPFEFAERMLNGVAVKPLEFEGMPVHIGKDSASIGCTAVSKEFVDAAMKRIGRRDPGLRTQQGECYFNDYDEIMTTGEWTIPYSLIREVSKRMNTKTK